MSGAAQRILAILIKEFIQLTRERVTYAMILVLPIVQLTLFGFAINNDPHHLPTAVLVEDQGRFSRSILAALRASGYFDLDASVRSPRDLDRLIETGRAQFVVTIPEDFSRKVVRGQDPQILIEADASDPAATSNALAALAELPRRALSHDLVGALAPIAEGRDPFTVVVHRRYNPEAITAYNIVPGLLGVILSMTLVMMTALSVTRERERGTMEGLLATPARPLEVMVGKLAPYVMVGLIQASLFLVLARVLFGVPMEGGWGAFTLGLLLFIVGSLAIGYLISTVARSQLQALQMSVFYILPSILLSGFMFPFAGMPAWARAIGSAIPVTHFLRIVRGSLLKGVGVAGGLSSLEALAAIVVVVCIAAVSRYQTHLD